MSRRHLGPAMDAMYKRRQKRYDGHLQWDEKQKYYKEWNTKVAAHASLIDHAECDAQRMKEWEELQKLQVVVNDDYINHIDARRDQLRMLLFKEEQANLLEIQCIPKSYHKRRRQHYKLNETPTEVLQGVNLGLKSAAEERRKYDAELKLYQKWRSENPIIRDYELSQDKQSLKLSWLDQQIRKRMEQERQEDEMHKMIEERNRLIEEDKEIEKLEREEIARREEELMSQIKIQIELLKRKNTEAELFKKQEECVSNKLKNIEDVTKKNNEQLAHRRNQEVALFNIKQSKLKLKQKAVDVEAQLTKEKDLLEEIIASNASEEIQNEIRRNEIKNSLDSFLNYFRKQKDLEEQRQKYIEFIFDSEGQQIWNKMEQSWNDEQATRDRLFQEVLSGIKDQIEEKFKRNICQQQHLLKEREQLLQVIEDQHLEMKKSVGEMQQKQLERKLGLDQQLNDKQFFQMQEKLEEEKKRRIELDDIRSEEEKLKQELMRIQARQAPRIKYKRTILW